MGAVSLVLLDRLHERREPAPGARDHPQAGTGHSRRARRRSDAAAPAAADGEPRARGRACGALGCHRRPASRVDAAGIGPAGVPRLDQVAIDGSVLAFIVLRRVCATALVFGWRRRGRARARPGRRVAGAVAAAPQAASVMAAAWADRGRGRAVGRAARRRSGLLLRSFVRLRGVDPGHRSQRRPFVQAHIAGAALRHRSEDGRVLLRRRSRLRGIPGVGAAGGTVRLALEGHSWTGDLFIDGNLTSGDASFATRP